MSKLLLLRTSWDVIRVSRFDGLQALARIDAPGAVVVDPDPAAVYFFVAPGTTAAWPRYMVDAGLSVASHMELPPVQQRTPPGMYWLLLPARRTGGLTCGESLRRALLASMAASQERVA